MTIKTFSFDEAVEEMRTKLYENELYRYGWVAINYDRETHSYHVVEFDETNGISSDEYPNSIDYCQIRILGIPIHGLDEEFKTMYRYNKTENNEVTEDELWKSVVDSTIEMYCEGQDMEPTLKAALFELNLLERGRYKPELRKHVDENNESQQNLNHYMREELDIPLKIRTEILRCIRDNSEFDLKE